MWLRAGLAGLPFTVVVCLLAGACASNEAQYAPNPEPPQFAQPFNRPGNAPADMAVEPTFATYNPAASTVFPDYRLNIGDVLEIIYHVRTGVTAEKYRLKVQDSISIQFPFQSSLNQNVTVQSDGTIRLLLVGEVPVVHRGQRGVSPFHFSEVPAGQGWQRFNPESDQWEPYAHELIRTSDGGWLRRDPATGSEGPLEDVVPTDLSAAPLFPCIVDAVGPAGRRERFEYDHVQQRWKTRPMIVEQKGMTAEELQKSLREEYGKYLKQPELTVTIQQANIKIEELKKAITTAPRGQSRLVPVKPDGTIDLPFIGEVLAFGKPIQQLKMDIEAAYAQVDLPEISVTVQMNEWSPQKVFVLGEVQSPGLMSFATPITLLQAISAAGGANHRAAEDLVMVIRRKGLPVPQATVVNLRSLIAPEAPAKAGNVPDFSNLRFDFYLADTDIVYVPSTALAVAGDWTEQVFRRIVHNVLPYGFYTGLNFGYEIHREPTVTKDGGRAGGRPNFNVQVGP